MSKVSKIRLPIRIVGINPKPDENHEVFYSGCYLTSFPSLTRVVLQWRSKIKPLFSKSMVTVPYIYYFYPEVRAAKRVLRKHFRDEERQLVLTHFNGIAVTQVVYCDPIIQAFFQFALMYAWQNSQLNKKTFSIKNAKKAFELAFHNSLNCLSDEEQSRSLKAAVEVFDFAFQTRWQFETTRLELISKRGRKQADTTKEILRLAALGFKPRKILEAIPEYATQSFRQKKTTVDNIKQVIDYHKHPRSNKKQGK